MLVTRISQPDGSGPNCEFDCCWAIDSWFELFAVLLEVTVTAGELLLEMQIPSSGISP